MPDPIAKVAERLGLSPDEWDAWGPDRAKLTPAAVHRPRKGRLVLVTAITPTPAGEGKTTTGIGLAGGLQRRGHHTVVCLREPSLGPVFGAKGGGTGGGAARLHPADAIDLHFTGDLHAITSANNLLAALVDNHVMRQASPTLSAQRVVWRRVLDMNDRALREVITGLGAGNGAPPRPASTSPPRARSWRCVPRPRRGRPAQRLGRMIVGFGGPKRPPITAADLGATGALSALLHDAVRPNLVQTRDGVPALVHGGPFANIAHGCSSVLATTAGLGRADWVVTEAGFAMDLGGEKFFDIKCRTAGIAPAAVVLVATVRALAWHGDGTDTAAVQRGLENLERHVESVQAFGLTPVVALNRRQGDADADIAAIRAWCSERGLRFAEADPYGAGGAGCEALADEVVAAAVPDPVLQPLYPLEASIPDKIERIATRIYGADGVDWSRKAEQGVRQIEHLGLSGLPVCMAKTSASVSDDPSRRGRPRGFRVSVQELRINAGAGFVVALMGDIVRMPGLPAQPNALGIDVVDGEITGLR
ncbi:MAG: formate--tetrahydrofolate ligase [Myxococcota bacterium]